MSITASCNQRRHVINRPRDDDAELAAIGIEPSRHLIEFRVGDVPTVVLTFNHDVSTRNLVDVVEVEEEAVVRTIVQGEINSLPSFVDLSFELRRKQIRIED